jgi:predicted ATPase/DNA-binding CsgD family transcriptional regulator
VSRSHALPTQLRPHGERLQPPEQLPAQPTPLLGRDGDLATLRDLLWRAGVRLVTLVGPGGVGKTRLALATAASLADDYADGVYVVDLAPIRDPEQVPGVIARALGLREGVDRPAAVRVSEVLRDKDLLLILDNCEQILGIAPFVGQLLGACPALVILATSRAPLRIRWERQFPVLPLAIPDPERLPPLAALAALPSVALFLDRARAAAPTFALTAANAPEVATLCARLDGLPLAIEMAAARIGLLSPRDLLDRLQERFSLLRAVVTDRPPRHQALRETIAWSHDLLRPDEQALFRRLAVFVCGCTLAAAEAVTSEWRMENGEWKKSSEGELFSIFHSPFSILEGLSALLNNSLLRREEGVEGESRFVMLETIREYGAEQLAAHGESEVAGKRHAAYFLALAEAAEAELVGPQQQVWLARLEREYDNFRAALDWFAAHGDAEDCLRLAGALYRFWPVHGHVHEGRHWLLSALADSQAVVAPAVRAKAVTAVSDLAWIAGDYAGSAARATEALALHRGLGDQQGQLAALSILGNALRQLGERERARGLFAEELALGRTLGDVRSQALALGNLGGIALDSRELTLADKHYTESLALARATGDTRLTASALTFLGVIKVLLGERQGVEALLGEGLTLAQAIGNRRMLVLNLGGQAMLALASRQPVRAARLLGAAEALRSAEGLPLYPAERPFQERMIGQARAALGAAAFDARWDEGRGWTLDETVAYALAEAVPEAPAAASPPREPAVALTRRERELLPWLARGLSNRAIAEELRIGARTVEMHVANLIGKLELENRAQVAAWAAARGLTTPVTPDD